MPLPWPQLLNAGSACQASLVELSHHRSFGPQPGPRGGACCGKHAGRADTINSGGSDAAVLAATGRLLPLVLALSLALSLVLALLRLPPSRLAHPGVADESAMASMAQLLPSRWAHPSVTEEPSSSDVLTLALAATRLAAVADAGRALARQLPRGQITRHHRMPTCSTASLNDIS